MGAELTSRERMRRILNGEIPDRIGLNENVWGSALEKWIGQGYPEGEPHWKALGLDLVRGALLNRVIYPKRSEVIEETDEWRTVKNGNGATLRTWKHRHGVPEHIGFEIDSAEVWRERYREQARAFLPERVEIPQLVESLRLAEEHDRFSMYTTSEVFEVGKDYLGHEIMCMGMLQDPEWIHDVFDAIITQTIANFEYAFEKAGKPDGVWLAGDIGFKQRPFIGLDMYREIVLPHNKRLIDFFKSHELPVIFHSCGFIEPLVPGFIESGIDMLQAMEVKAGVDLRRLKPLYGDRIGFMGNVDVRVLETNDLDKVEAEVRAKVECGMEGGGYCFMSDHSIPPSVDYDTYRFALDLAGRVGTY